MTFAPTKVLIACALQAIMPPTKPVKVAAINIHRLPNLSEILPNNMIEMALATDQMIENRLAFALGPMSLLIIVITAAAGLNPQ